MDYIASQTQCAASLMNQNMLLVKRAQSDISLTDKFSTLNTRDNKQRETFEPKHVLIIECKDENINNSSQLKRVRGSNLKERKDEVVHFDLYTRNENKYVKHLASYTKDEDSNNLSLKIDLGQDSSLLPIENFENQHVVVMSLTDSNNRQKKPNVTLTLANAESIATLARSSNVPLFRLPDSDQVFSHTRSYDLTSTLSKLNQSLTVKINLFGYPTTCLMPHFPYSNEHFLTSISCLLERLTFKFSVYFTQVVKMEFG